MEETLHIFEHALGHSLADTLYLIPILLVTYLVMEWIEHKAAKKTQQAVQKAGSAGPVIGALLGVIPQCGFSAMAATLYAGRVITLGTLFAVFLSTSDEMLPIFLASQVPIETIFAIVVFKILIGMIMGFSVDAVYRMYKGDAQSLKIHEICERDKCGCSGECATCKEHPEQVYEHHDDCPLGCDHSKHTHDHSHDDESGCKGIVKSALKHTVQVMIFIFIITFVLNAVLEFIGEDALAEFLQNNQMASVFASALVGLIPNCAASIVIADLYIEGVLGAGAMIAGLLVSAGVGLLVLFRTNRHWKENLVIVAMLYLMGVFWGVVINALGIVFM